MSIIDYIPYGKDNVINRKQLCIVSGLPDRLMRKEIERSRQDYAILNAQDGKGYYRPTDQERHLAEKWLRQELSRGESIRRSTHGVENWLVGKSSEPMIKVRSYVRRKHKTEDPEKQIEGQMRL